MVGSCFVNKNTANNIKNCKDIHLCLSYYYANK
jgi:hypothetical protein